MKNIFSFFFLLSFFVVQAQTIETELQAMIDSIYAANPDAVGVMAHVESPSNNISWSGAAGYCNQETEEKLSADQPALIASSIKTYVSASILRLVELGEVELNQAIGTLLTDKTRKLFAEDGYDLEAITVANLLSHTSGVEDYVSKRNLDDFFDFVDNNKKYRWTRDALLELTVEKGDPIITKDGLGFNYADANFLLLTEIIEELTGKPFYTSMRELLKYEELGFKNTWFPTLEETPKGAKELVHQYYAKYNWDSYDMDISWDLYGGGGIATTTKEIAQFSYHFFNGNIVKDPKVQNLIFTEFRTKATELHSYYLGLSQDYYHGMNAYGHGGFWSTTVLYYPSLDASISVFILDKKKSILRRTIEDGASRILKKHVFNTENTETKIKEYLNNLQDFSGTILVASKDSIVLKRAYGMASIEHAFSNNVDTKFNIASITKTITAVAALQLYEQGKVGLKKTVGDYLPDYPNSMVRDSVTIHQLLTHTSGIKPFYGKKYLATDKLRYREVRDYLPLFSGDYLLFKPGSSYKYSGSGFVILGLIIEKVTGQNYYEYIDQNIFQLANMPNSVALEVDAITVNKASGYTSLFGDLDHYTRNDYYLSKASPAGSHYSTIEDIFNFSKALRNHTLLSENTTKLMLSPKVRGYNTHLGYGIDVDQRYDERIIGHSGGWFGVRCEWMDFLASDLTIVVLSNKDDNGETGGSKVIEDLRVLVAGRKK